MMRNTVVKIVLSLLLLPFLGILTSQTADAVSLANPKDTISTSRPSAAAPLGAAYGATDTQVTITNNGSRFLASDSARIINGNGVYVGGAMTVASQSAPLTTVYLSNSGGTAGGSGSDTLIVPVTAKHTIQFTTVGGVPSNGKIVVTFPGSGLNTASPSASTFSFNGLTSGNISISGASCGSYTITAPSVTCNLNAALSGGTAVTLTIGSSTPALINPTSTAAAGSSDSWQVNIQTTQNDGTEIDGSKIRIATIESVRVTADVDPSITFTIAGVNNGTALSGLATGCADSTQNAPNSTATDVSLGFLRNGQINLAAQQLTVSTNGSQGYTISATSSGRMINPATGYWIYGLNSDTPLTNNDTPVPAVFRASGNTGFGINACGPRINTSLWGATSCTTAL